MTFSTRILRFVTRKGAVTNAQVAKFIGRNSSFAWQELNRLVRRGLLKKGVTFEDGSAVHRYFVPSAEELAAAECTKSIVREAVRPDAGAL